MRQQQIKNDIRHEHDKRSQVRYQMPVNKVGCLLTELERINRLPKSTRVTVINVGRNGMSVLAHELLSQDLYEIYLLDFLPITGGIVYDVKLPDGTIRYGFSFDEWLDDKQVQLLEDLEQDQ